MPRAFLFRAAAAALFIAAMHLPATAGRTCEAQNLTPAALASGLGLAQRTHEALEAAHAREGTRVVLLARAGQDLSKYGLQYSHLGIAYRTELSQGQPAWRVLHKLNQCGTAGSDLFRQGLGEFFLDQPWRYEAAWVVPTPQAQARLLALLGDEARSVRLHHAPYSIVSYAWGRKYQQSNQWAIETLASALEPQAFDRERAQAWLRLQGYAPTTLRLGPLTRLGGRATAANVAFDDHPNERRFADRIDTVTVDSVFAWMQRSGLAGAPVVLR